MNTATQIGTNKQLRDTYALADKYRDPQGVILSYANINACGSRYLSANV